MQFTFEWDHEGNRTKGTLLLGRVGGERVRHWSNVTLKLAKKAFKIQTSSLKGALVIKTGH